MRILIVEDDPSLASGLARILEAEGYAVDVAGRGEEAVGAARGERFDLVILDIGLPGMDGFEVLRRLRGAEYRVPVLVLTARDTVSDRVHGLDLGADRKSTRLNSSHLVISYAVFCLKKKKK